MQTLDDKLFKRSFSDFIDQLPKDINVFNSFQMFLTFINKYL